MISDPRRISDSLALLILGGILVAIVAILVVKAVVGVRGGGHKAWTVVWLAASTLLAISTVWSGLADDDFTTSLIWSSFILPFLAAILSLVWLVVTVIIRRGRRSALTFVGWSASLAVMGVFAVAILVVPSRLAETSGEASLVSVFPPATGWSPELLGDAFDFAQDLRS